MNQNKKIALLLILFLVVLLATINVYRNQQSQKQEAIALSNPKASKDEAHHELATDFSLKTVDGETIRLSDYRGKTVILNFWATWCPPCQAEMPHIQKFHASHKENVEVIAVNLTSQDNGTAALQKFIDDYKLTFTIPLDTNGTIGKQYKAYTVPTSYIIDSKGYIVNKVIGPMNQEMMEKLVQSH